MVLLSESILTFVRIIESSGKFRLLWLIATTTTKTGVGGEQNRYINRCNFIGKKFKIFGELSCDCLTNSVQVFVAVLLFETVDK